MGGQILVNCVCDARGVVSGAECGGRGVGGYCFRYAVGGGLSCQACLGGEGGAGQERGKF